MATPSNSNKIKAYINAKVEYSVTFDKSTSELIELFAKNNGFLKGQDAIRYAVTVMLKKAGLID